jgi:NAD(P)-dependent dehydrogenase (short-subunit alcohol dehydrogenase family)
VAEPRSVVITGASRGLGLASAAHLYRGGWTVVAAMRSPDLGLQRLRAASGAAADDPRLVAVRLDLDDPASIAAAAEAVSEAVGAPDALVHNAGVAAVGCAEEMPASVWSQIFSTNVFGPVRLTHELLPAMRAAGRGRIVVVSSQGGVRGMPAISAYSAAKGALERWAEALSHEVAPFGIGVTILVAGTFKTDILELTETYADPDGPYAAHHAGADPHQPVDPPRGQAAGTLRTGAGTGPDGTGAHRPPRGRARCQGHGARQPPPARPALPAAGAPGDSPAAAGGVPHRPGAARFGQPSGRGAPGAALTNARVTGAAPRHGGRSRARA